MGARRWGRMGAWPEGGWVPGGGGGRMLGRRADGCPEVGADGCLAGGASGREAGEPSGVRPRGEPAIRHPARGRSGCPRPARDRPAPTAGRAHDPRPAWNPPRGSRPTGKPTQHPPRRADTRTEARPEPAQRQPPDREANPTPTTQGKHAARDPSGTRGAPRGARAGGQSNTRARYARNNSRVSPMTFSSPSGATRNARWTRASAVSTAIRKVRRRSSSGSRAR